jgi:hypothetical protein
MKPRLVAISWSDPEEVAACRRVGLDDDPTCATGIFVVADNADEALKWANTVAARFMEFLFANKEYSIEALEVFCWVESDPERSSWKHCLDFFQKVAPGEYPDFQKMTSKAYSDWCRKMGLDQ